MIQIDLFSDVICPWCFIGKRRLERALNQRSNSGVDINWRAFQLNPDMPKNGMPRDHYLEAKFGGPDRAKTIYDNIRKTGETEGIEFEFEKIQKTPNTVLAHRLISWSKDQKKSDLIVESLFKAYFYEGRDIGSLETLKEILEDSNIDTESFVRYAKSDEGIDQVANDTRYAYSNGITGVPCFIFDKKYSISGAQEPEAFFPLFDLNINNT